jgi:hypothetical protein
VLLKFHLLPLCLSLVRWWRFAEKSTVQYTPRAASSLNRAALCASSTRLQLQL